MNGDTEYIFGEQHLFYDRSYIRHFSEVYAGTPTLNRPLKAKKKTVLNKHVFYFENKHHEESYKFEMGSFVYFNFRSPSRDFFTMNKLEGYGIVAVCVYK